MLTFCEIEDISNINDPNLIAATSRMTKTSAKGLTEGMDRTDLKDTFESLIQPAFCDNFNVRFVVDCKPFYIFFISQYPIGTLTNDNGAPVYIREDGDSFKLVSIFGSSHISDIFGTRAYSNEFWKYINSLEGN